MDEPDVRERLAVCDAELERVASSIGTLARMLDEVDALSKSLEAVEQRRVRVTHGARTRVQKIHSTRLGSIMAREAGVARAAVAESVATLSSSQSNERVTKLNARLDEAIAADKNAWAKTAAARAYHIWGEFCLWLVLVLVSIAPALCGRLGLPVESLRALKNAPAGGNADPASARLDSGRTAVS